MNSSKGGRTIALFTGAGVIGIAVLGFLYWKDLAAQYHLYRLRSNVDYFLAILEEPEGTPQGKAVRVFLRSGEGKEALFRQYVEVVLGSLQQTGLDAHTLATVIESVVWARGGQACYIQWGAPKTFGTMGIRLKISYPNRWKAVQELVETLDGAEFFLSDYPTLKFSVLRGADALDRSRVIKRHAKILPGKDDFVCRITRRAEVAIPRLVRLLGDSNLTIRQEAAYVLGGYGATAKEAVPALEALLKQRRFQREPDGSIDYRVQKAVEEALGRINGEQPESSSDSS